MGVFDGGSAGEEIDFSLNTSRARFNVISLFGQDPDGNLGISAVGYSSSTVAAAMNVTLEHTGSSPIVGTAQAIATYNGTNLIPTVAGSIWSGFTKQTGPIVSNVYGSQNTAGFADNTISMTSGIGVFQGATYAPLPSTGIVTGKP